MPLGKSAAHKICVSALELAKTLVSKEALKSFQRGVGFLIRWQCFLSGPDFYGVGLVMVFEVSHVFMLYGWCYMLRVP